MLLRHIEPQNGGKRFLLHFEDSELLCGPQEILDFHLEPELELDEAQYAALCEACTLLSVKAKAAALVSARAMSSGELLQKLLERGASQEHAEAAVSRLSELGILNDLEYARSVVRHCGAKGYGLHRAGQELYRRRIPKELWTEALSELNDSDDALDALIEKKLRGRPLAKEDIRPLSAFLLRRGYGWDEVQSAINRRSADSED